MNSFIDMDLQIASKNYFCNLNALAKKISVDIENTQEAYQEFWNTLSRKDQEQVVDDSIICPSAVIKYAHVPSAVVENNPNMHSWFTKSQLDLFNQSQNHSETSCVHKSDSETKHCLEQRKIANNQNFESIKGTKDSSNEKINNVKGSKQSVLKPKIPPPPPPSKNRASISATETSKDDSISRGTTDIPKTGFDFLDNW